MSHLVRTAFIGLAALGILGAEARGVTLTFTGVVENPLEGVDPDFGGPEDNELIIPVGSEFQLTAGYDHTAGFSTDPQSPNQTNYILNAGTGPGTENDASIAFDALPPAFTFNPGHGFFDDLRIEVTNFDAGAGTDTVRIVYGFFDHPDFSTPNFDYVDVTAQRLEILFEDPTGAALSSTDLVAFDAYFTAFTSIAGSTRTLDVQINGDALDENGAFHDEMSDSVRGPIALAGTVVPEPGLIGVLALGAGALAARRRGA